MKVAIKWSKNQEISSCLLENHTMKLVLASLRMVEMQELKFPQEILYIHLIFLELHMMLSQRCWQRLTCDVVVSPSVMGT